MLLDIIIYVSSRYTTSTVCTEYPLQLKSPPNLSIASMVSILSTLSTPQLHQFNKEKRLAPSPFSKGINYSRGRVTTLVDNLQPMVTGSNYPWRITAFIVSMVFHQNSTRKGSLLNQ